jgi:hypothetical protein
VAVSGTIHGRYSRYSRYSTVCSKFSAVARCVPRFRCRIRRIRPARTMEMWKAKNASHIFTAPTTATRSFTHLHWTRSWPNAERPGRSPSITARSSPARRWIFGLTPIMCIWISFGQGGRLRTDTSRVSTADYGMNA